MVGVITQLARVRIPHPHKINLSTMDYAKLNEGIKLREEIKNLEQLKEAIIQHEKEQPRAVLLQLINEWRNVSNDKTKDKYLAAALFFIRVSIADDIKKLSKQFEEL